MVCISASIHCSVFPVIVSPSTDMCRCGINANDWMNEILRWQKATSYFSEQNTTLPIPFYIFDDDNEIGFVFAAAMKLKETFNVCLLFGSCQRMGRQHIWLWEFCIWYTDTQTHAKRDLMSIAYVSGRCCCLLVTTPSKEISVWTRVLTPLRSRLLCVSHSHVVDVRTYRVHKTHIWLFPFHFD